METILQLSDVIKTYSTEQISNNALNGINLEIRKGDFLAVMGPSGCGKSTLLNMMGLLDIPTKGDILFLGQKILNYNEKKRAELRKRNIGFVFQNFNLIDDLTVFENIELPLIYLKLSAKERKELVYNVMAKLKISHRATYFPRQLSGGQQQRVAICRALVAQPSLLLADEPTGNLDSRNREEVMQILWQLNQEGVTIVIVTHSSQDADYAHGIIHLLDGQIVGQKIKNQILS
ncbi:phosphonate ABC transporter ATP-binding protein [bacterium 336/3]|nr:phosphonate ABC transporter ATP-binding protein [bacterium 336/3]